MDLAHVLGMLTVFPGIPLNIIALVVLYRAYRRSPKKYPVLRLAAISAFFVLVIVVVFGLIFLNNDAPIPPLTLAQTKLITRWATLVVATIPASYLLWIYYRSKDENP